MSEYDAPISSIVKNLITKKVIVAFSEILAQSCGNETTVVDIARKIEALLGAVITNFPRILGPEDVFNIFERTHESIDSKRRKYFK